MFKVPGDRIPVPLRLKPMPDIKQQYWRILRTTWEHPNPRISIFDEKAEAVAFLEECWTKYKSLPGYRIWMDSFFESPDFRTNLAFIESTESNKSADN